MKWLLVSATPLEIQPTLDFLQKNWSKIDASTFEKSGAELEVLITGIGMMATAFTLGRKLITLPKVHQAIHAGIGGAIDRQLSIGQVCQIIEDQIGDLGAEEKDGSFLDAFDLGLVPLNDFPYAGKKLKNPKSSTLEIQSVNGLTLNKVSGTERTIHQIKQQFPDAQMETMESAAFFFACLTQKVPFLSLRSISNYVEPRNRKAWNIPLAVKNLNHQIIQLLEEI